MEHLPKLIQKVCPDSKVALKLKCGRTKTESIVTNVIGAVGNNNVIELMKKNKFSIILDESTDRFTIKHMAVIARIVDPNLLVRDEFVTLIEVEKATADALYELVTNFFIKNKIPFKENLIGYAGDGANNMMGKHHSLATNLMKDVPDLFIMKCICHSFHLCASYACLKLPRFIEDFARNVHNYLNNSSKRLLEFKEFQVFCNVKPHKILYPGQTRWLSLLSVVNRLIQQFTALKLYFTTAVLEDKILNAQTILESLSNPFTLLYLQFLAFVLPFFVDLNIEMQSEGIKIHLVYDRIGTLYKEILECYIQKLYIKNKKLYEIQYKNPSYYLHENDLFCGGVVSASICSLLKEKQVTASQVTAFKNRCLSFYIEATQQINIRFPFQSMELLKNLKILEPKIVFQSEIFSLGPLASNLPILTKNTNLDDLDREWRKLSNMERVENLNVNMQVITFWSKVINIKKSDNTKMFPLLTIVIKNIMTLPHSSACVERIFSCVNLIKTKYRNRLNTHNLIGLLHTKQVIKDSNCYLYSYESNNFMDLFNQQMYDFKI